MRCLKVLVGLFFVMMAAKAMACASCGSGDGAPIVLYPGQMGKVYLGLAKESSYIQIKQNGDNGSFIGPESKISKVASAAFAPNYQTAIILTANQITNYGKGGRSFTGMGDPSLGLHWRVVNAAWDRPEVPQLKLIASYKPGNADSIYDMEDSEGLDILGNGFTEYMSGIDLWWGMQGLKFGSALSAIRSEPKNIDGLKVKRGDRLSGSVTAGYKTQGALFTMGRAVALRYQDSLNNEKIGDSDSLNHAVFGSVRVDVTATDELRLTMRNSGIGSNNKNTSASKSVNLGYAKVF